VEQEAILVAFRKHTLLPLDDCLYALQASIPKLTRVLPFIVVSNGMASAVASRSGATEFVGQKTPRRAGSQKPQDALEVRPVGGPGTPSVVPPSFRGGSKGSISSHCSSVSNFCHFYIAEVQQPTRLTRKYPF
jgi:hypothetical protein